MGLGITVFTEVKLVQDKTEDIECLYEWAEEKEDELNETFDVKQGLTPQVSLTVLEVNPHFPKQSKTLCDGVYEYKKSERVLSRAYSGWSNVREELAKASGYLPLELTDEDKESLGTYEVCSLASRPHQAQVYQQTEGILWELINFSDCEGIINNVCCKKIYKDLGENVDVNKLTEYGLRAYNELLEGFKIANDENGVMRFS